MTEQEALLWGSSRKAEPGAGPDHTVWGCEGELGWPCRPHCF